MIKLFRISTSEHINDITGTGARIYGGRWNNAGYPIIYSSGSRSLAALEFLVHVPMALAPEDLSILEINIIPYSCTKWYRRGMCDLSI